MKTFHVDANVILRYLTGKPGELAEQSRTIMNQADRREIEIYVSPLIVAEVYWVLSSYYEFSRDRIRDVLGTFLEARGIRTSESSRLQEALDLSAEHNVDFIDALLALRARDRGETVATFDEADFEDLPCDWIDPGILDDNHPAK